MAIARIAKPFIRMEHGSNAPTVQKDAVIEASGANGTWANQSLVYTSGTGASTVLNKLATAGTVIYGQAPAVGNGQAAVKPPTALFGNNHFPFDLRDRILEINVAGSTGGVAAIGTTNGVTWLGGGTSGVALAPGQQYGVFVPTTGAYAGIEFVDPNNTTQKVFEIVALAPENGTGDNNPRIWVKVIPTVIQG